MWRRRTPPGGERAAPAAVVAAGAASTKLPFDHDGRPAVRAYVFTADDGAHQWVAYLEKSDGLPLNPGETVPSHHLVKKPGGSEWALKMSTAGSSLMLPNPPPGMGSGPIQRVQPEQ